MKLLMNIENIVIILGDIYSTLISGMRLLRTRRAPKNALSFDAFGLLKILESLTLMIVLTYWSPHEREIVVDDFFPTSIILLRTRSNVNFDDLNFEAFSITWPSRSASTAKASLEKYVLSLHLASSTL